uniref:hypothetical protein n=1 Tax=Endozoicomonas sp. ONNA2 TaxID=2828741 RepID=UPI002148E2B7
TKSCARFGAVYEISGLTDFPDKLASHIEVLKTTGLNKEIQDSVRKSPLTVTGQRDYLNLLAKAAKVFNCPEITDPVLTAHESNIPGRKLCFFASEQLEALMDNAGFIIEPCEQGKAPHYPVWSHGDQDKIRIIGKKPA